MEINEKDLLDLFTRLWTQLEQAGINQQGCNIQLVYVAPGAQHVDRIENNYVTSPLHSPSKRRETTAVRELPEELGTPEAMKLWKKAQKAGYVDELFQPLISRSQAALLADCMAERLGIREKWKTFEAFWRRNNMRNDYNYALGQRQSHSFMETLDKIFH